MRNRLLSPLHFSTKRTEKTWDNSAGYNDPGKSEKIDLPLVRYLWCLNFIKLTRIVHKKDCALGRFRTNIRFYLKRSDPALQFVFSYIQNRTSRARILDYMNIFGYVKTCYSISIKTPTMSFDCKATSKEKTHDLV